MKRPVSVTVLVAALAAMGCQAQPARAPEPPPPSALTAAPPGPPAARGRPDMTPGPRAEPGAPWGPRGDGEVRPRRGDGDGRPVARAGRKAAGGGHGARPRHPSRGGHDVLRELGALGVRFHPPALVLRRARAIGLTPDQVAKVREEMLATRKRTVDLRAKLEHAKVEVVRLLAADKVDERALNAQLDEGAKAQGEMHKLHVGSMLRVRALLTAEQRQKLDERRPPRPSPAPPSAGPTGRADDDGDDDDGDDDDDDETEG